MTITLINIVVYGANNDAAIDKKGIIAPRKRFSRRGYPLPVNHVRPRRPA